MDEAGTYLEGTEFVRGDYKTTIMCKFNEKGLLISHSITCDRINSNLLLLTEQLHEAIETQDFRQAALIQAKINKVRESKPTL